MLVKTELKVLGMGLNRMFMHSFEKGVLLETPNGFMHVPVSHRINEYVIGPEYIDDIED